ncbi:MAG TPA: SIR2 family protein [Flavilitoribacter sp.]|nr:SIR2 family protein [Flavilitoribacter sp.]
MADTYPKIDWDFILETIKAEKCILFVGPELYRDETGRSLDEQLGDFLEVPHNPDIQAWYERDGLFLFTSGAKKTTSYYKIKHFYNQSFPKAETLLEKLAVIPFHFIISILPDKKCAEAFERADVPVNSGFYWKKQAEDQSVKSPSARSPLVYNLFGSIDRQESMVLTHDDLFEYFESVFQENSIPEKLKLNIRNAHNFIFLGLDFEKWYMQLLLRILHLHNEKDEFMRYAANQRISDELRTFCFQQFRIEFVADRPDTFVDELAARCAAAGVVREKREKRGTLIDSLVKLLEKDRLEEVFTRFSAFLDKVGEAGENLADDLLLLSNRHKRLERKIRQGVLATADAGVETNQIRLSLLELLKEAKTLE